MLYVFYGSDTKQVRQAAQDKLTKLREDNPNLNVYHIESEAYEPGQIINASSSVSLFSGTSVYLIDTPSNKIECLAEVEQVASAMASSGHHFIVIEGNLLATHKKLLGAESTEMTEYKSVSGERFDAFKLADGLARRDKRSLWFLLMEARRENMSAEEIIGILWWQLKTLRLAFLTKNSDEAGIKDFPYNKAKRALVNFKSGEVESLSRSLLTLYHEGHAGKRDINLALEEWILKM